jgi:D-alanine transaminase
MSRIAYVNGRYLQHGQASVHIEDRGFQFSDGVYEVCEVRHGALIDAARHLDRLERSLAEMRISMPKERSTLVLILCEVVRRNRVRDGMVYLQVTRGTAMRDHSFPKPPVKPTLVVTARALNPAAGEARAAQGVAVITLPENRWKRVDIKTVALVPNVLARQAAREAGAFEAWFTGPDGNVIEGAATNAWIVTGRGVVVTHPADRSILAGVTRSTILDICQAEGIPFEERPFSLAEACGAAEAFCSGATLLVMPVISIDGCKIGQGVPGPVATGLRKRFHDYAASTPLFAGR